PSLPPTSLPPTRLLPRSSRSGGAVARSGRNQHEPARPAPLVGGGPGGGRMTALLEVEDLRAGYGSVPVLQGVSFAVSEGETAVMFGLNGAGKSTTINAVAGLLKPAGGTVRFDGTVGSGKSAPELVKKGVALCPEG